MAGDAVRPDQARLARALVRIAREAGAAVMAHYGGPIEAQTKADQSPVTAADHAAEAIILKRLAETAPEIPVISEEAFAQGHVPTVGTRFFLVDPLDGTKEFISRNGEFTVNIALIVDRRPVLGVVYAPAKDRLFYAEGPGRAFEIRAESATPRPIAVRPKPADGLTAVASRSHRSAETEAYLTGFDIREFKPAGSSLKFCLIAAGQADLYPRHGPTMEWDTAAGHAVLAAAGGSVTLFDGTPLRYGKTEDGFRNPYFVARGATD